MQLLHLFKFYTIFKSVESGILFPTFLRSTKRTLWNKGRAFGKLNNTIKKGDKILLIFNNKNILPLFPHKLLNLVYLQFSQKLMIIINSNFYFSYDISY